MKLQIETLTPPPPPAMGPAEAAALLAYLQAATDAHSPGVSSWERVLLCAAVGWLREVAGGVRGVAESPFDGWMIQPWEGAYLRASKDGMVAAVGAVYDHGWYTWPPTELRRIESGPETGQAGRDAVAAALRSRGAKL